MKFLRQDDGSVWGFNEGMASRKDMTVFECDPADVPENIPDLVAFLAKHSDSHADSQAVPRGRRTPIKVEMK